MAYVDSSKLRRAPANGEFGDLCTFPSSVVLAANPIADVIRFAQMPAGCEIIDVALVNDALGASVTLNAGYEYVRASDGAAVPAAFQAAAAKSAAGKSVGAFHPIEFDSPINITATIAGAAATGKVTALITYRFLGNK
jgi:hypothetical protein